MFVTQQFGQRWETYRPTKALLVWSCAVGAIGVIVVGFTWGGWVTGGTARAMAQNAAVSAHDELVAVICVERFQNGRDAHGQLAALKELQGWNRAAFIEKGARQPDGKPADCRPTASLCGVPTAVVCLHEP